MSNLAFEFDRYAIIINTDSFCFLDTYYKLPLKTLATLKKSNEKATKTQVVLGICAFYKKYTNIIIVVPYDGI